jgi:hypothetical protein
MPYRLQYLPRFYDYLNEELTSPYRLSLFQGFSIYEVKGAFKGARGRVYDEPTMVVRLIYDIASYDEYDRAPGAPGYVRGSPDARIEELANQLVTITAFQEEEIWIMRYRAEQIRLRRKRRR